MKYFTISSVAVTMLTFITHANAYVTPETAPGIPTSTQECLQQGGSPTACKDLFEALRDCKADDSPDQENWRECIARAERDFEQSLTGADALAEGEPYVGESLPVKTESADSHYEQKSPDHKGFLNSDLE